MDKKEPTRKDVAKLAGVSETIVSYVINQNRYVKKEKKERVLAAMKELNYKPNRFARALKGKNCKHIVMLIDRIRTEYYGELVSDMERFSSNLGYMLSISVISNSKEYVDRIIAWRVDAVIISSISLSEEYIQRLIDSGILVILMKNREYSNVRGAFTINTGLYQATKYGVHYLYDVGCRKIAYIDRVSKRGHFSDSSDYRYSGYCAAMEELGLGDEKCLVTGCHSASELQQRLLELVKERKIDALYGRNDNVAIIAMNILIRKGYKIPEDISIIGLDDTSYSKYSIPTLSSMRMKREEIAKAAIGMIEDYNKGETIPDEMMFIPELIIRESVRKKKQTD